MQAICQFCKKKVQISGTQAIHKHMEDKLKKQPQKNYETCKLLDVSRQPQ